MYNDMEVGKPIELEELAGSIERLGKVYRVPMPLNAAMFAAFAPHINGAPDTAQFGDRLDKFVRYHSPTRSAHPPGKHTLVYDGECQFCRSSAELILRRSREEIRLVTFREIDRKQHLVSLNDSELAASSHYITPSGIEYHGGESVTRVLRLVRWGRAFAVFDLPGASIVRELVYAIVARNRSFLSKMFIA